jgi:hypothetical protein
LIRRKADGFSEVVRAWEGEQCVILGGGPSLTQAQVDTVRGKARVIAINRAFEICPWADVLYFADAKFYRKYRDDIHAFRGIKVTNERADVHEPEIHVLRYRPSEMWSDDPGLLVGGEHGHSGSQCINLAALAGAKDIVLLGYDAREPKDGRSHWHAEYPWGTPVVVYGQWRSSYRLLPAELEKRGIRVVNCSPGTAIEAFPRMKLEDVIESGALRLETLPAA